MEFALVLDNTEIPLSSTDAIAVPFKGKSGTPTCDVSDYEADTSNEDNYFRNDFDVFVPTDPTESNSLIMSIVQTAMMSAVAVMAALLLGGII